MFSLIGILVATCINLLVFIIRLLWETKLLFSAIIFFLLDYVWVRNFTDIRAGTNEYAIFLIIAAVISVIPLVAQISYSQRKAMKARQEPRGRALTLEEVVELWENE